VIRTPKDSRKRPTGSPVAASIWQKSS